MKRQKLRQTTVADAPGCIPTFFPLATLKQKQVAILTVNERSKITRRLIFRTDIHNAR